VIDALEKAYVQASDTRVRPTAELVEKLGGGWGAEEALAISIYCALAAKGDFAQGLILAVNHGGDSNSTGAITGNIMGALLGRRAIPVNWLERLELRQEIETVALDLFVRYEDSPGWKKKYPV
jgi:ADP-ribosylglycohydrolase